MFSRMVQGVLPGLTVLPTGLWDGLSHLTEKQTSNTSADDLAELSTIGFPLNQITAHKNSAGAGTQAVKEEDNPTHPFLF